MLNLAVEFLEPVSSVYSKIMPVNQDWNSFGGAIEPRGVF